jgi:hypothetical protein
LRYITMLFREWDYSYALACTPPLVNLNEQADPDFEPRIN